MNTIKNKIYAAVLLALGALAWAISTDATMLIVVSFIAVPLFFAKENWIEG